MGGEYSTYTKSMVLSGMLSNQTVDRAVGNILRKKFASGLFDQGTWCENTPLEQPEATALIDLVSLR